MPASLTPLVETTSGPVLGIAPREDGIFHFRGLPYADVPIGTARFQPPQPHPGWSEPLQASVYRAAAPQLEPPMELLRDPGLGEPSDDCLHLNIATPGLDMRLPVLFWIHGGGFNTGSGANGLYRSVSLPASGDCVLVTINYRLGPLGFLRLDEATDGAAPSSGTEGLQDQVAALQWVHRNIERFGGDPDNITLMGESAGGMSVASLLAMPSARGLFQRAVIQSGGADIAVSKERGAAMGEQFVKRLREAGHDPAELDTLDWRVLVEVAAALRHPERSDRASIIGMPMVPVLDENVLPQMPLQAIEQGDADDIDLLVGWTRDEWNLFAAFNPAQWQMEEMRMYAQLDNMAGPQKASELASVYQGMLRQRQRAAHPGAIFSQAMTDYSFRLPSLDILNASQTAGSAGGGGSARAYTFTWESPLADGVLGACHALELPFLFGSLRSKGIRAWAGEGDEAEALSVLMQQCWRQFASSGEMEIDGASWPLWSESNPVVGNFCATAGFTPLADRSGLNVWSR